MHRSIAKTICQLFLALLAMGLLVSFGFSLVEIPRESTIRATTQSRISQILIAILAYEATHGRLPPAVVTDANGTPLYSGRVLLLPYLNQQELYQRFDKSKPWNSPENLPLSSQPLDEYRRPGADKHSPRCDFVFVTGNGTAFDSNKSIRRSDIKDVTSTTLLIVELAKGHAHWAEPVDWDATTGPIPPGSHYPYTFVGAADGQAGRMTTSPPNPYSRAICTIAGGEDVPVDLIRQEVSKPD